VVVVVVVVEVVQHDDLEGRQADTVLFTGEGVNHCTCTFLATLN
jgi:hypothetical protein